MFENEIKFINDFILNKTKDLGSLFTIENFLSADIHPAVKKYVEGEINYLIYQDRKKLIDNSLFDYSGAKISNYFNLIADEIKKTKKVSYEDVKNIILQAVAFNANFVVRPKWTLSKLIFGNNKSASLNDLQILFNYTYYYEYLNNVFLAYMVKKKIMNISTTEFELIMNKIDRELFTLHQSKLVDNALYAIADFYNIGGLNKSSISVEAIENFLKEKNLTELLFKLKRGFPNPAKKKNDMEDIRKILYSAFPLESPFDEEKKEEVTKETNNEEHFENPLKEISVSENPVLDEVADTASDNIFDLKKDKLQEEIFEEELPIEENEIRETKVDLIVDDADDLPDDLEEQEIIATIEQATPDETSESIFEDVKKTIDDEKILSDFTEDLEGNQEDEIIILDEKEEKDLLNFFDDEAEISIDDDDLKKGNNISEVVSESVMEDETPVNDNEIEMETDETSLEEKEKIEFELINHDDLTSDDKDEEAVNTEESGQPKTIIDKTKFDDMLSFLSRKEIEKITKNLFNSDSEEFANTIEKMSACNSLEEATEILENIFKYARIKPHSKEADSLTKAVTNYFHQSK
jgi:hypothetical protein